MRQRADELLTLGTAQRRTERAGSRFVHCRNEARADVFAYGAVVPGKSLQDGGRRGVQVCRIVASYVDVVDEQLAGFKLDETEEDFGEGGFTWSKGIRVVRLN